MASPTVLVVEDDPDIAGPLLALLEAEGYRVSWARDGVEALLRLRELLPDVVVSDVQMPTLDGPGLVYRMFVEDCGMDLVPVILVSASPRLADLAARLSVPYFLAKPCDFDELRSMIRLALRERRPPTVLP
ncbi:response regulator [Myxococcota bacterium]|nr:response regulator [Myxococcota bacterium]